MRDVLRVLWGGWRAAALRIGRWQSRLILSLLYFVVVMPVAVAVRILGDPLNLKGECRGTHWRVRDYATLSHDRTRKQ